MAASEVLLPAGQRLAILDAGPRGGAPPWLLVHGWAGDKELWAAAMARLALTMRCVAPDLPGHGGSPADGADLSPLGLAGTLDELLAALDLGPVVLVAHSYGCFAALHLALEEPQRLRALVVSNPPHPSRGVWSARHLVHTRLEAPTLRAMRGLNAWVGRLAPAVGTGPLAFSLGRARAGGQIELPVLSTTLRGIYESGLDGRLARLTVPTLVLGGRLDLTAPPGGARALAGQIPGAALHVFPRASHHPMAEAPDDFVAVVRRFVDGLPLPVEAA